MVLPVIAVITVQICTQTWDTRWIGTRSDICMIPIRRCTRSNPNRPPMPSPTALSLRIAFPVPFFLRSNSDPLR
ncbi:hypothetical protein BXZ70DRAFT_963386 [Cristinia sonorae]|uniref:Uncharacterized protein n=1 Tax=Cristinia sonorae TaxID=1940300 RepID=A0A8K0UD32_9AGAR|nr:hypothetical protein BXZ70DRAFT_963386 [Cristinia sonorae]